MAGKSQYAVRLNYFCPLTTIIALDDSLKSQRRVYRQHHVRNNLSDFTRITEISLPYVLLIGCVCLAMLVVNGLFLKVLTVSFGIDLHFFEYFYINKKFKIKKAGEVNPEHVQPLTGRHKEQLTPQP